MHEPRELWPLAGRLAGNGIRTLHGHGRLDRKWTERNGNWSVRPVQWLWHLFRRPIQCLVVHRRALRRWWRGIGGCTDSTACNYVPAAVIDDGSCLQLDQCGVCGSDDSTCGGCTDSTACNFDPTAILDDGSCIAEGSASPCPFSRTTTPVKSRGTSWTAPGPRLPPAVYVEPATTLVENFCAGEGCYTLHHLRQLWRRYLLRLWFASNYDLTVDGALVAAGGDYG